MRAQNAPADAPLVPLHDALSASANLRIESFESGWHGDARDHLRTWCLDPGRWEVLDSRGVGNADEVSLVYLNCYNSDELIGRITRSVLENGGTIDVRGAAAAQNVRAASTILQTALLGHLRSHESYEYGTCSLARTAIELAARAVHIARGKRDEGSRFLRGEKIQAADAMATFDRELAGRTQHAGPPNTVYGWLCRFTHMDSIAMQGVSHEQAYAALAYVCWSTAAAAEVVVGGGSFAVWPPRWPAPLPWRA